MNILNILLFLILPLHMETENTPVETPAQLKVLTWNIWGKLNRDPRYTIAGKTGRERMIEILKASGTDIITMTETYGSAKDIAESLNYYYFTPSPTDNLTIFSRYPLENAGTIKDLSYFSFISATVLIPGGMKVRVYNIWLTSSGRHIVEIKNKELSDEEFTAGDDIRYNHIQQLLTHPDFLKDLANKDKIPIIVSGDFNSVSHLDYTKESGDKGLNFSRILPIKVSIAMQKNGFTDSYRFIHPEITPNTYGYTWTTVGMGYMYKVGEGFVPVENNPKPKYRGLFARIDFIYCTGNKLKAVSSRTISHHPSNKNRSFPEFPSDHAAVLTGFELR